MIASSNIAPPKTGFNNFRIEWKVEIFKEIEVQSYYKSKNITWTQNILMTHFFNSFIVALPHNLFHGSGTGFVYLVMGECLNPLSYIPPSSYMDSENSFTFSLKVNMLEVSLHSLLENFFCLQRQKLHSYPKSN